MFIVVYIRIVTHTYNSYRKFLSDGYSHSMVASSAFILKDLAIVELITE